MAKNGSMNAIERFFLNYAPDQLYLFLYDTDTPTFFNRLKKTIKKNPFQTTMIILALLTFIAAVFMTVTPAIMSAVNTAVFTAFGLSAAAVGASLGSFVPLLTALAVAAAIVGTIYAITKFLVPFIRSKIDNFSKVSAAPNPLEVSDPDAKDTKQGKIEFLNTPKTPEIKDPLEDIPPQEQQSIEPQKPEKDFDPGESIFGQVGSLDPLASQEEEKKYFAKEILKFEEEVGVNQLIDPTKSSTIISNNNTSDVSVISIFPSVPASNSEIPPTSSITPDTSTGS